MKISAELSLYPLTGDYKPPIRDYIQRLESRAGLTVRTNALSTEVFGDYDTVMGAVNETTKALFELDDSVVLVAKYLNTDRS